MAATAFARHGYTGVSLNEIVRETGLTKGGFYFHFPSKQALALACIEHKQAEWIGRVVTAGLRGNRAVDQLASIPGILCDLQEQDPAFRCIGRLCAEIAAEHPERAPDLVTHLRGWAQLTASLLRRGQEQGDVRPDLDPDEVAEVAVEAMVGIEEVSFLFAGGADFRRRVNAFVPLFLRAIGTVR